MNVEVSQDTVCESIYLDDNVIQEIKKGFVMKWSFMIVLLAATAVQAAVVPNGLFTDRMAIQRNQDVAI